MLDWSWLEKEGSHRHSESCGLLGLSEYMVMPGQMDSSLAYQGFDAFAFPSTYEGFGMAALEAQRAGLPCLLSDAITREVDVTGAVRFLPIDDPSAGRTRYAP